MRPIYGITGIVAMLTGLWAGCMGHYALYLAFFIVAFVLVILDICDVDPKLNFKLKPIGTLMSKPDPVPFAGMPKCPKCRNYAASQDTRYKKGVLRLKCGTCKHKFMMQPADRKERGVRY